METVNNLTSAASRAIWGDPNKNTNTTQDEEPMSGETGDVSSGEPYDKGNVGECEAKDEAGHLFCRYSLKRNEQLTLTIDSCRTNFNPSQHRLD